jgi:hypothetical protein
MTNFKRLLIPMLFLAFACGDSNSSSTPDLSVSYDLAASQDLSMMLCSGFPCCPNDAPPTGACTTGDQCASFELFCQCESAHWSCQGGPPDLGP